MIRQFVRPLAFVLIAIGGVFIAFTIYCAIYLSTQVWADNSRPGWLYFVEGAVYYGKIGLVPIALGYWLYRWDKKHRLMRKSAK